MSFSKRLYEQQPSVVDRLESIRSRVHHALCCADDGKPTFATLDEISRALVAAKSDLARLAVELEPLTRHGSSAVVR